MFHDMTEVEAFKPTGAPIVQRGSKKEGKMTRIEKSIFINASREQVFDLAYHPERTPEWLVGMSEVRDVSPGKVGVGTTYHWTFHMAGVKLNGKTTFLEFDPPNKAVIKTEGSAESIWTWTYEAQGDGTLLTCAVEYTMPGAALGKIADKLIVERTNANSLEQSLKNIKSIFEA
jgi:carbon monoxide dehydrogenase subunit G